MTTYDELARRYIDSWNETDPSARRAAVDQLYTERRPLRRPAGCRGRPRGDRVDDRRGPATVPRLRLPAGGAGRRAPQPGRFGWELGPAGAPAPIVGFDVAVSDDSGRIQIVLGFLDKVPTR
ncbi:MAG: nuclear transport factor 2 family protein [Mycobacterium sp.]|uniref:nuclear transport factor 2 family protein n=1 Tax=Mycobacterium sp. TaxID=1785 RepID=UPI00389A5ECF